VGIKKSSEETKIAKIGATSAALTWPFESEQMRQECPPPLLLLCSFWWNAWLADSVAETSSMKARNPEKTDFAAPLKVLTGRFRCTRNGSQLHPLDACKRCFIPE
jgi:hypothetical protein